MQRGLRRAEMCHLKVSDNRSKRMVIHVRPGHGGVIATLLLNPSYWIVCASTGDG